ncbi:uncharacterized protein [Clytia hemisphaerica]|uniref:Cnidarian restricted protein n=1 Tax=Clytia hemisphaerica TaxID=252671 RepID=A0A7M5XA21_9CNID|eukprot:TCONS_00008593-protein
MIFSWLLFLLNFQTTEGLKCKAQKPQNEHGIKPIHIIDQETDFEEGHLKALVPRLSTEWIVDFQFVLNGPHTSTHNYCNIFRIGKGDNWTNYGDRLVALFFHKAVLNNNLSIFTAINGADRNIHGDTIIYDVEYKVKVQQKYHGNNIYKIHVHINDQEVSVVENAIQHVRQFYDLKVYVGDPWYPACNGKISNVKIINFL